jgi:hypothetical protein
MERKRNRRKKSRYRNKRKDNLFYKDGRRKVRRSGAIFPSHRYAISVCKVHFSRRPAFAISGLRPLTSIDKLSQAINQSDSLHYYIESVSGPAPVYSYAISITAKVKVDRILILSNIASFL